MGSAHPLMAPYQAFQTKDGWLNVGAANRANWERLLTVLEAESLADDPRFVDNAGRIENLSQLVEALTPYFHQRTTEEWLTRLDEIGVPAGPVLSIEQMHQNPQTQARKMVDEVQHSRLGPVKTLGIPVKHSHTPGSLRRGAPLLGEHTREVLLELGYTDSQVDGWSEAGVIIAQ
jgi:crotonobetainyl-CoA:carnitine CoA-transferase CaiB-like acyl-CoA transferase